MSDVLQCLHKLVGGFWLQGARGVEPRRPVGEADFRSLTKNCVIVLCSPGRDLSIRYVSPDAYRLFRRDPAEILGRGPNAFIVPEDLPQIAAIGHSAGAAGRPAAVSVRILHPDGGTQWIEATGLPLSDPSPGHPGDTLLVIRDIPRRSGLERRLASLALIDGAPPSLGDRRALDEAFLALTDPVTGLANRDAFDDALDLEWCRAQREGTDVSLLLLGLDGFKAFDDAHGRRVEEASLRAVAATLEGAGRRVDDFAARYRGDDLALLLPNTPAGGAAKVAHRIQANVAALGLRHTGAGGQITASLGAVTGAAFPGNTTITPLLLAAAANAALEQARRRESGGLVAARLAARDVTPAAAARTLV